MSAEQFKAFLNSLETHAERLDSVMRGDTPMQAKGYHVGVYLAELKAKIITARNLVAANPT